VTEHPGVISPGRVAVVTGAASGIGLGLSERFVAEGMNVVMADVEEPALLEAAAKLSGTGAAVLPVITDVSSRDDVEALRDAAVARFGAVHLLCNNAGVGGPTGRLWLVPDGDWQWVLGVNLGGVINGIRAFVPLLLEQEAAHIVNTASIFGVFAGALGPYGISKHAIVAATETLHADLRALGLDQKLGLSVLCPGAVRTNFGNSARNRPPSAGPTLEQDDSERARAERFDKLAVDGRDPAEVAGIVVDGIREGRFYILTSANRNEAVRRRAEEILSGSPPAPPFP
jgi:NAD(P)-dependent dehydrogenase (short-subunit alcohol dehydrogenase family)